MKKTMKIAIISTPWIKVPPKGYGGTESVVYNLTEGLIKKNHQVTLFATGDSRTSAHLDFFYKKALGNNYYLKLNYYHSLNHIYYAISKINRDKFDIIHNHAGRVASYFLDLQKTPFVHTLHGSYNKNLSDQYQISPSARESMYYFKHHPYVSISNRQRYDIPELNFIATIYNGINIEKFDFSLIGGLEIVWIGRITKTKGIEELIKTINLVNKKLKLSFFIDKNEEDYFNKIIKPLLNNPLVDIYPEIKEDVKKTEFLAKGRLFLFPIQWDEPFGIVMIESMACGTPVVAFARGSVPEVVKDGETGFIVNPSDNDIRGNWIIKKTGIEGLCEAVERIYSMAENEYRKMRRACREYVEKNFTVEKMVNDYEKVYQEILAKQK